MNHLSLSPHQARLIVKCMYVITCTIKHIDLYSTRFVFKFLMFDIYFFVFCCSTMKKHLIQKLFYSGLVSKEDSPK